MGATATAPQNPFSPDPPVATNPFTPEPSILKPFGKSIAPADATRIGVAPIAPPPADLSQGTLAQRALGAVGSMARHPINTAVGMITAPLQAAKVGAEKMGQTAAEMTLPPDIAQRAYEDPGRISDTDALIAAGQLAIPAAGARVVGALASPIAKAVATVGSGAATGAVYDPSDPAVGAVIGGGVGAAGAAVGARGTAPKPLASLGAGTPIDMREPGMPEYPTGPVETQAEAIARVSGNRSATGTPYTPPELPAPLALAPGGVEERAAGLSVPKRARDAVSTATSQALTNPYAPIAADHPALSDALQSAGAMTRPKAEAFGRQLADRVTADLTPEQAQHFETARVAANLEEEANRKANGAEATATQAVNHWMEVRQLAKQDLDAENAKADAAQEAGRARAQALAERGATAEHVQDALDDAQADYDLAIKKGDEGHDALQKEAFAKKQAAARATTEAAALRRKVPAGVEQEPWFQEALAKHNQMVEPFGEHAALQAGVDPGALRKTNVGYARLTPQETINEELIQRTQETTAAEKPRNAYKTEAEYQAARTKAAQKAIPRKGLALKVLGQKPTVNPLLPAGATEPLQGPVNTLKPEPSSVATPTSSTRTTGAANEFRGAEGYSTDYRTNVARDLGDKVTKAAKNQVYQALAAEAEPSGSVVRQAIEKDVGPMGDGQWKKLEVALRSGDEDAVIGVAKDMLHGKGYQERTGAESYGSSGMSHVDAMEAAQENFAGAARAAYDAARGSHTSGIRKLLPDENPAPSERLIAFNDQKDIIQPPAKTDPNYQTVQRFAVSPDVADAFARYQKGPEPASHLAKGAAAVNKLVMRSVLSNPLVAAGHTLTEASNVSRGLPAGEPAWVQAVTGLPVVKSLDAMRRAAAVDMEAPETTARLQRLALSGSLRIGDERGQGWVDAAHAALFGPNGVDTRMRLVASEDAEAAWTKAGGSVKDPAFTSFERDYVNGHSGNYVAKNQGTAIQELNKSGLTPFIAIGRAKLGGSLQAITGGGGPAGEGIGARILRAQRGPLGQAAAIAGAGYLLSGHSPAQNAPGHETDMASGVYHLPDGSYKYFRGSPDDAAAQLGPQAKEVYLRKGFTDPASAAALRLLEPIAFAKKGDRVSESVRAAANTAFAFVGPTASLGTQLATGHELYLDKDGALGSVQGLHLSKDADLTDRLVGAARNMNAGVAIGMASPAQSGRSATSAVLGNLNPFAEAKAGTAPREAAERHDEGAWQQAKVSQIFQERDPAKRQQIVQDALKEAAASGYTGGKLRSTFLRAAAQANVDRSATAAMRFNAQIRGSAPAPTFSPQNPFARQP